MAVITAAAAVHGQDFAAKELRLDVDAHLFFRNNEFSTPLATGYTLPGFRLCPSVCYTPSSRIKLEGGVYMLRYWGTNHFPNMAYRDIAYWKGGDYTSGFHLLPMLRGTMVTPFGLEIVLGTLHGGSHHDLIEPLYAPELDLTADPEAGVQLRYNHPRVKADVWVNWESFIYRGDTHQEAFTFGLSAKARLTRESSRFNVYLPVSVLAQHRGGEIDTLFTNSMQTLMNASAGAGVWYDSPAADAPIKSGGWFNGAGVETDVLLYRHVAGSIWPYRSGKALWAVAKARFLRGLDLRLGWFGSDRFISMFGYPIFGSVSATNGPTVAYGKTSALVAGAHYSYEPIKGYSFAVDFDLFHQPRMSGHEVATGTPVSKSSSTSYCFGFTMILKPSFLLKRF